MNTNDIARKDELYDSVLGCAGLNPFRAHNSSSRESMSAGFLTQCPEISGAEQRRIFTGMELNYRKYTFNVHFPVDARILRVLHKYPPAVGLSPEHINPATYVIYEPISAKDKTIGILEIPRYMSYHKDFGFELIKQKGLMDRLVPNNCIPANEMLAGANSVMLSDELGHGVNANVAFLSKHSTIEDGIIVTRRFLEKLKAKMYHKVSADYGRKYIPVNLYGDEDNYQPFPNIGEKIREDGLIYALREIDENTSAMDLTPEALRRVDYLFDKRVYGEKGATVVDLKVYRDDRLEELGCPDEITAQARKYYDAGCRFYSELLSTYEGLQKNHNYNVDISNDFHRMLVEGMVYMPQPLDKPKLHRKHRLDNLDEWRVDIFYEKEVTPDNGWKLTDLIGGKGVNCLLLDYGEEYFDVNGNIIDIIIAGSSTIKRTNLGRFYEQFFNAVRRDNVQRMRLNVDLPRFTEEVDKEMAQQASIHHPNRHDALDRLRRLYENTSPTTVEWMASLTEVEQYEHLAEVLENDAYLHMPPSKGSLNRRMASRILKSDLAPVVDHLHYWKDGVKHTTKSKVLTGEIYQILLEKHPKNWASCASTRNGYIGLPSRLSNADKHSTYGRTQITRFESESEVRPHLAYMGPRAVCEILDISNNPDTFRHLIRNIIKSPEPSNEWRLIDRDRYPLGGSRAVKFVNNIAASMGVAFTQATETEKA